MIKNGVLNLSDALVPGTEVWAFGSMLIQDDPRDLDLIVIFPRNSCKPERAIAIRKSIRESLSHSTDKPIDITLLSDREAAETDFIKRAEAQRIL